MAHYFFNILRDDHETTDLVGEDCADLKEVRREALNAARDLVLTDLLSGRAPHPGWIEVEDEEHRPVLLLPISAAAS